MHQDMLKLCSTALEYTVFSLLIRGISKKNEQSAWFTGISHSLFTAAQLKREASNTRNPLCDKARHLCPEREDDDEVSFVVG
jgi:hypothetical protein